MKTKSISTAENFRIIHLDFYLPTDLWYSIKQVGPTGRFRLIMVKPIIDELAALKESVFKWSGP
jgi:hypothetical protein